MAELVVQRSKEHELRLALRQIRSALDAYRQAVDEGRVTHSMQQSGYPPSLKVLVEGVPDASSPDRKKQDLFPAAHSARPDCSMIRTQPDEETWGKRSYASSFDAPEEGEDVFDVYSLSPGVGLNGISYRNW